MLLNQQGKHKPRVIRGRNNSCSRNWIWLIPGNIIAIVLLLNFQYNRLPVDGNTKVITKYVYHSDPNAVWMDTNDNNEFAFSNDDSEKVQQTLKPLDDDAFVLPVHKGPTENNDIESELNAKDNEIETIEQDLNQAEQIESDTMEQPNGYSFKNIDVEEDDEEEIEEEDPDENVDEGIPVEEAEEMDQLTGDVEDTVIDTNTATTGLNPQAQVITRRPDTFASIRSTAQCSYLCNVLKRMKWRNLVREFITFPPSFLILHFSSYKKYKYWSHTVINQIGSKGSSCIGGGKGKQLRCRENLAKTSGCNYPDLKLQPRQWNLQSKEHCVNFFAHASAIEHKQDTWIAKPGGSFHGDGITVHHGIDVLQRKYGSCRGNLPEGLIVQEYIGTPILWGGHKFDFRSFLLISSTSPFIVFHHPGFVRRAELKYSTSSTDPKAAITNSRSQGETNHFFGFEQLQDMISSEHSFPTDYLETHFYPHAQRIALMLFNAAKPNIERRKGRYQLYALDWMLDDTGAFHLLEGNGNPAIRHYPDTGLTPDLWESLFELEKMIHFNPEELPGTLSVAQRFRYKRWRLIYNELEAGDQYNVCEYHKYVEEKHPLFSFV